MKLADLMKMFGLAAKEEHAQVDLKNTEELQQLLAAFDEKETQLIEALDQIDALNQKLEQYAEQTAKAEADAKQVKMDARMASLSKEVGDERAKKVLAATEGMDDTQFNAIADALKMSADTEAKSKLFNEEGVDSETNAEARAAETTQEMKILQEKYKKSA